MQLEKQRPAFAIFACEQQYEAEFDGLTYKLRIDRIDLLAENKLLLLDYKSGTTALSSWLEDRPSQPQLPLYALTYADENTSLEISGIAFAEINAKTQRLLGIADLDDSESIKGITATERVIKNIAYATMDSNKPFQNLKDFFAKQLQLLSQEYQAGYAAVQFKNPNEANRIDTDLLPLNRYYETEFIYYYLNSKGVASDHEH